MAGSTLSGYGGAAFVSDTGSQLSLERTAILDNMAVVGSGLYQRSGGSLDLTNVLLSGNNTNIVIRALSAAGSLTLDSTTIAGNATTAIGIFEPAFTINMNNSVIWDNSGGVSSPAAIGGNGCNISQDGVGGAALDPHFMETARGPYHLGPGSNALDACSNGPSDDLDNRARPRDGNGVADIGEYDIGAFECRGTTAVQPILTASITGADVELSWTNHSDNDAYQLHRSSTPYFAPGPGSLQIATWNSNYTDAGAAAAIDAHYYTVGGMTCNGAAWSDQVGEFSFAIQPGL